MRTFFNALYRTWIETTVPSSQIQSRNAQTWGMYTLRFREEIRALIQQSPCTNHIACQLTGFAGDDHIAWLEIQQSGTQAVLLRQSVDRDKLFPPLSVHGFVASQAIALLLDSLPPHWQHTSQLGPEIMFGGESALIWIKQDHAISVLDVNFVEGSGSTGRLRPLLSRLLRFGRMRLFFLGVVAWILRFPVEKP
jgi:hypothetical protein